ncbi:MAG TPA: GNVR domain-containing protein [Vicinamibacterales bacterium]
MRDALARQRLVVVGIFVVTLLKVYVTQSVIPEVYEARAAISIPVGRDGTEVASEIHVLRSRQLLGEVVDAAGPRAFNSGVRHTDGLVDQLQFAGQQGLSWARGQLDEALIALDLKQRLSDRDLAIVLLERALEVESQTGNGVIVLRLRMADAAAAVKVEEILLERYQARRAMSRPSRKIVPTEVDTERLRENLARAEEELKNAQQTAVLAGRATNGAEASASLLAELDQRRSRAEQIYLASLKRQHEAAASADSTARPITIAAAPMASLEPVYPHKLFIMALGALAGLLIGIAVAVVREWTSDAVRDPSHLELATGVVCFGAFVDQRAPRGANS